MHIHCSPRRLTPFAGPFLVLLIGAACAADSSGPGWTFAPLGPTPPPASATPGGQPVGELIELQMQGTRFVQSGQPLAELRLTLNQPYTFRVDNLDGFDHNIYFGPPEQLAEWDDTGLPGHEQWPRGVREFTWTPSQEAEGWQFACTVPGHYQSGMRGELLLESAPPDGASPAPGESDPPDGSPPAPVSPVPTGSP